MLREHPQPPPSFARDEQVGDGHLPALAVLLRDHPVRVDAPLRGKKKKRGYMLATS